MPIVDVCRTTSMVLSIKPFVPVSSLFRHTESNQFPHANRKRQIFPFIHWYIDCRRPQSLSKFEAVDDRPNHINWLEHLVGRTLCGNLSWDQKLANSIRSCCCCWRQEQSTNNYHNFACASLLSDTLGSFSVVLSVYLPVTMRCTVLVVAITLYLLPRRHVITINVSHPRFGWHAAAVLCSLVHDISYIRSFRFVYAHERVERIQCNEIQREWWHTPCYASPTLIAQNTIEFY